MGIHPLFWKVYGVTKVKFDTAAIEARIRAGAMAGVINGANMVQEEAIRTMTQDAKTGKHYRGNPNRSSAPGESPARQTGRLIGGIDVFAEPARLAARVNASTSYAAGLEFGTEKVAPRPFMRPSLAKMRQAIEDEVRAHVGAALSGTGVDFDVRSK